MTILTASLGMILLQIPTLISIWNLHKDMNEAKRNVWMTDGRLN